MYIGIILLINLSCNKIFSLIRAYFLFVLLHFLSIIVSHCGEFASIRETEMLDKDRNVDQGAHHMLHGERLDLSEGDITNFERSQRNAVVNDHRWPGGVVPYTIHSGHFNQSELNLIEDVINEMNSYTCAKFVPKAPEQNDFVLIARFEEGCFSAVGWDGGEQQLNLDSSCMRKGFIKHELMHALGFFHEQNRVDRDRYVTIHWENIVSNYSIQFHKYTFKEMQLLGEGYDYNSILHYNKNEFSKNGNDTITPNQSGITLGPVEDLSEADKRKIRKLYECDQEH